MEERNEEAHGDAGQSARAQESERRPQAVPVRGLKEHGGSEDPHRKHRAKQQGEVKRPLHRDRSFKGEGGGENQKERQGNDAEPHDGLEKSPEYQFAHETTPGGTII